MTSIREEDECVGECRIGAAVPTYRTLRVSGVSGEGTLVKRADLRRPARHEGRARRARSGSRRLAFGVLASGPRRGVEVGGQRRRRPRRIPRPQRLSLVSGCPCACPARIACAVLARARQAGLTPGAFVASLVAGVPVLTSGQSRGEHLAALVASNAEMATLARKVGQLASLFRQGSTQAAHEYRAMLDGVAHEVREHIRRVSAVLADLRPGRASKSATRLPGGQDV